MPTSVEKPSSNRDVLLEIAEELFANHGYDGVSLRNITEQAGTRLASVNYFFGSKEKLFVEVITRRAFLLSKDRVDALREINFSDGGEQRVLAKRIVEAFVLPLLWRSTAGDQGWKNYCRLIAQVAVVRDWIPERTVDLFNPVALEFVEALEKVFPDLDERQIHYCFQFMLGSTLNVFVENQRLDSMSHNRFRSSDLEPICESLITFISAGITALAT